MNPMILNLQRVAQSQFGTFGVISLNEVPLCVTAEEPWADNKPNVSCIPEGVYNCIAHNGPKKKGVWEITNVPGRTGILIHEGNDMDDTTGCVLVGRSFRSKGNYHFITDSVPTLYLLRGILRDNFVLKVVNQRINLNQP